MHEGIRLSVIALNEAEALHCVEELDGACSLLTRKLTLRTTALGATCCRTITRRAAIFATSKATSAATISRRNSTAAIDEGEFKRLPFGKAGELFLLDCGDVDENVLATIITDDEAWSRQP